MNPSMNVPLIQSPSLPNRQNGVFQSQWHFQKTCHPNQECLQRPMDSQIPSINSNQGDFSILFYLKSDHLISQKLFNIPYISNDIILKIIQNNINFNLQQLSEYGCDQRNDHDHNQRNLQMLQSSGNNKNQIQEDGNKELRCANLILKVIKNGNDYNIDIKEETEGKEDASIDIYILPSIKEDSENEKENIFKIFYECRKKVDGMIKVKINFEDVILKYKEISLMNIIQMKQSNSQNNCEKVNDISVEINEGKGNMYVYLMPNGKGKCKYKTEISFKNGNEEIIKIPIELETMKNVRNKPDSIKNEENPKLKCIYSFLLENSENFNNIILEIFNKINEEKLKYLFSLPSGNGKYFISTKIKEVDEKISKFFEGLGKYLKKRKLERFLEKENKSSFFEQIKDLSEEDLKEEIFSNIESIFNEIKDNVKKNKLLIMCFDYLYICSIDVFKNVDIFRDINSNDSIIGYYSSIKQFLEKYGTGYCTKNNKILLFRKPNDRKRSSKTENNEYYGKRQRMSIITGNDGRQTIEDSDSEDFIS